MNGPRKMARKEHGIGVYVFSMFDMKIRMNEVEFKAYFHRISIKLQNQTINYIDDMTKAINCEMSTAIRLNE